MHKQVLELRPTQMAVGMKEVDYRIKKMKAMKHKELEDYLHERRVPVVMGPRLRTYIIDRHHLTRACWESGIQEVPVDVKTDLSRLSDPIFWKAMRESHGVFPFDQFGNGPHDPVLLPEDVRGLADDPFRSLAWRVRQEDGFAKSDVPFAEFQWANFFRSHVKPQTVLNHFEDAVKEAVGLSKSPSAKHLPGYSSK